jgi:hypothetical protein
MPHCGTVDKLENPCPSTGYRRGWVAMGGSPDQVAELQGDRVADDLTTDFGDGMEEAVKKIAAAPSIIIGKHTKRRREQDPDHETRGDQNQYDNRSFGQKCCFTFTRSS